MPKALTKQNQHFLKIWESAIGFYRVWIVHMGRRYGLFNALAQILEPVSPDELAISLKLAKKPIITWCDAAYSLGLLRKIDSKYVLPKEMVPLLCDEEDISFIGGLASYLALRSLDFNLFDDFFRNEEPAKMQQHLEQASYEGTLFDHTAFIKLVLPKEHHMQKVLENGASVIDIGSGSGNWSLKMARHFPNSHFLGIDPNAGSVEKARKRAQELCIRNVEFKVSNAESMEIAQKFDVVYFGEVLYLIKDKIKVLKKYYNALKKNGSLIVCEGLIDHYAKNVENQLIHAMQLDFELQGGEFFTKDLLQRTLAYSGFGKTRFYDVGGGLWFVIACK